METRTILSGLIAVVGPLLIFGSMFLGIFLEEEEYLSNHGANLIIGMIVFGVMFMLVVSIQNWRKSIIYKVEFIAGAILAVILIDMFFFCNFGLCPE